jgi:hypothetical protein
MLIHSAHYSDFEHNQSLLFPILCSEATYINFIVSGLTRGSTALETTITPLMRLNSLLVTLYQPNTILTLTMKSMTSVVLIVFQWK